MIRKIFAFLMVLTGLQVAVAKDVAQWDNEDELEIKFNSIAKAVEAVVEYNNDNYRTIVVISTCKASCGADGIIFSVNSGKTLTLEDGDWRNCTFEGDGTTSITGGTYDFDPSSWLADGYSATKSGDIWMVAEASGHEHQWKYDDSKAGELTASCTNLNGTCVLSGQSFTLSMTCEGKTYDGEPVRATVAKKAFEDATGLTVGGIVYRQGEITLGAAPVDAGDYTAEVTAGDYIVSVAFAIAPIDIAGATVTLSATSFNFDGTEKNVSAASVKLNETTLKAEDYEPDAAGVTASTKPGTYTAIVKGKGNYTGTASATWEIVGPTGEFGQVTTATAGWAIEGTTNRVTDSTKLVCKDGKWTMSMTVEVPHKTGDVACIHPESLIKFSSTEFVEKQGGRTTIAEGSHRGEKDVQSFTWTESFTLEEIKAAEAEGTLRKTLTVYEISYSERVTVAVVVPITLHNDGGLRETTFVMEVPLEGLVLRDEDGFQIYPEPEHAHDWACVAAGATLTAVCNAGGCPVGTTNVALKIEDLEYGAVPQPSVENGLLGLARGMKVGEVGYIRPDYSAAKWYTGDYTAVVTVTVENADYELKKDFSITKPAADYTTGYEVCATGVEPSKWVSYDTWKEATDRMNAGETNSVHAALGYQTTFDFSSDKDITVDLRGQTLTYDDNKVVTVRNDGTGTVTLIKGTLQQPKGTIFPENITVTGKGGLVFGEGLKVLNVATTDAYHLKLTADQAALTIVAGAVEAELKTANGGSIAIAGGKFTKDPSGFLADGCIVKSIDEGDYKFSVISHTHDYDYTVAGQVITVQCNGTGEACEYAAPRTATLAVTTPVTYTGKPYAGATIETSAAFPEDAPTLAYYTNGVKLASAPVNAGEYAVVMSAGDKAVTNELTITAADLESATLTLTANELKYTGEEQIVGVKSVTINGATLALGKDYFVDESSTLKAVGAFASTETYTITIRACVGGNVTGTASATWKIVSSPRELGTATKTVTGGNATYASDKRTLQIADGTGWKYYPAKDAPDGSGVEGWYAGLKVTWPDDIDVNWANLLASRLLYTRPEDARFTVGAIKEGEAKRIFSGTNSIPGVSVGTKGFDFDDLKLTSVSSFTWWERLTLSDLRAAKREGKDAIEPRTLTAWGTIWGESVDLGILGEFKYGDPNGVRPTTYTIAAKVKANGEDIRLYDGEGNLVWPEHAHEWIYTASDTAVTARCAIAGCRYDLHPAVVELSANPAKKLCDGTPLAATLDGAENFADVTEATVGGILYSGTSYRYDGANRVTTPYSSELPPAEPGTYRADATTTLTNGTTYALSLSLAITNGLVSIGGRHYETAAEVLEKQTAEALDIVVWQGFTAEKTYVLPKDGVKALDLDGKTIAAPIGETTVLTNLGTLTIADSQGVGGATKKGQLYGDIVNQGTLVITGGYFDGTIVNDGGTVQISRGKFKVRPDAGWIVSGSDIVNRSGLYCVEPHVHDYGFVRVGSVLFATCRNILADWSLTVTHCDAREVVFFLSPMRETQLGLTTVNLPTSSLVYNGSGQGVELTGINLSALQKLSLLDNLSEYGDIIRHILALAAKGQNNPTLIAELVEIITAIGEISDFDVNDLIVKSDEVAAVTGLKLGEIAYSQNGVKLDGEPVNAGSYRAEITVTTPEGKTETLPVNFAITPAPIDEAVVTCNPLAKTFVYDETEKTLVVSSVRLGGIIIDGYKSAEEIIEAVTTGSLNAVDLYNIFKKSGTTVKGLLSDLWNLVIGKITIEDLFDKLEEAFAGVKLEEGVDYTIGGVSSATDIGAYVLTVDGKGNYQGSIPIDWTITYDHNGKGHNWAYTLDGAKLTATCQTQTQPSCLISPAAVELVPSTVAEKEYDGEPLTASLSNAFVFASYTGAKVGEVGYRDAGGAALASAPVAVGEYWATADVEIAPGTTNTLKLALAITVPEGGFADGYEVRASGAAYGVRHDTLAEALAAAKTGDTIFAHDGITGKGLDFTTDADVTIDLCEKTLTPVATSTLTGNNDMAFRNAGAGTVTFVNGTIRQPLHYILGRQNADQLTIASGKFVFGEKLATVNVATSQVNFFTVTVADGASLAITGGRHDAKFAGTGTFEVTGGSFWASFNPAAFVPEEGYVIVADPEVASRKVVVAHVHNVVATVAGNTISMGCETDDGVACDLRTPATATLSIAAATAYTGQPVAATVTTVGNPAYALAYFAADDLVTPLGGAPKDVGEYAVVMTAGDAAVTNEFEITIPLGGFTDGFEVGGKRYDTLGEALAAAGEGDTLYLREPLGNQALFDFTSEKTVTIDLCGQALTYERSQAAASDLTIQNVSTGIVTLMNGTIAQPRGQSRQGGSWQNVYYDVDVTGPFVFGEGLETEKRGTAFTVTADALAITDGAYESAFAGELTITGGTFASDPGEFVPAGYMTVEDEGVWVVINHTHAYAYAAEGQTIVRTCVGGPDACPDAPVSITLSVAAATAYTGNPVAATVTPSDAFDHALAYYAADDLDTPLDGAPADVGEYAVVMTAGGAAVTNFFAITPVALTSLALAEGAFVCDGTPKTNAVADVRAGSFTLTADDYTVAGDGLVQTGALFSDTTYTVIVRGTGNFTGAATNTWAILASREAFEAWRNLYFRADLADFGLNVPLNAKAVKAEGLPAGLKLVKTAVKDAAGKKTVGYRYTIEGVPTELMDYETRSAYVRITDAAGVQTLWPLALRVSEPEPGEDVEGTVGRSTLVVGGKSDDLFRVTKIWSDAEIGWTYKGWPSGITYDKDTGYFHGTPKKAGRYTLTATSGKIGSTTYKNVRTATFTVWADADGELSELTGQAYVAQTNGMDRFGAVKSVTGLPTGLKFTAKDVTDRTYGAIPSNTVYGLPTKTGTFAVTLTLADKSKKSLLWTIAPAVAPTCKVVLGNEADTPVERRRAQLVRGSARRYEIATSDPKATVTVTGLPSGLTLKKTAVKDASGKTTGYTYALEGVPTKVGEFFVTVKTTLNGVTTVSTLAFTVNENPFTGLYKGLTALDGRIGAAELSAAAGGTVKLTLKEGKTTYTANVKSFEWNGTDESGRAVFLLKATSADKKAGFPDREIEALMLSDGTATVCDVLSSGETCELFRTVKPTAEEMPSFTATYRFATKAGGPLAVLAVVYDAKKATASVKGKLADGTSVSMASIAVLSNGFLAPVQAVDKSGTAWVFDRLGFEDSAAVGAMSWMGEEAVETATAYGSDVTANPKPKFGAVVTEETTLDFAFGDETESFRLVPNGKGGVAVYEAETANPLLTVSSSFANGLLSFSFTSKTVDKAKYAVDLVLDAESLPSGQVLRTWKDGSTNLSSAGVTLLTVQW